MVSAVVFAGGAWQGDEEAVNRVFSERAAIWEQLRFWLGEVRIAQNLSKDKVQSLVDRLKLKQAHKLDRLKTVDMDLLYRPTSMDLWIADDFEQAARRISKGYDEEGKWLAIYEKYLSSTVEYYSQESQKRRSR